MPRKALLVIDLQRDAFDGVRCSPIDEPEKLVYNARLLPAAARKSETPVVFVRHCDLKGDVFEEASVHGELHDALAPQPGESVLRKSASSAFEGTDLTRILEGLDAREPILLREDRYEKA